ncbi:MAG: hypothetical protein RLO48_04490 [Bauldia litoralis]
MDRGSRPPGPTAFNDDLSNKGTTMKTLFLAATALLTIAGTAQAKMPSFNATCPTNIEVHADEGGPVYVNGKEAKLKVLNDNAYEATHAHVIISVTINPDGSPSVSYTRKSGANGICAIVDDGFGDGGGCPADVSEADRYKYPACN